MPGLMHSWLPRLRDALRLGLLCALTSCAINAQPEAPSSVPNFEADLPAAGDASSDAPEETLPFVNTGALSVSEDGDRVILEGAAGAFAPTERDVAPDTEAASSADPPTVGDATEGELPADTELEDGIYLALGDTLQRLAVLADGSFTASLPALEDGQRLTLFEITEGERVAESTLRFDEASAMLVLEPAG